MGQQKTPAASSCRRKRRIHSALEVKRGAWHLGEGGVSSVRCLTGLGRRLISVTFVNFVSIVKTDSWVGHNPRQVVKDYKVSKWVMTK